MNFLSNDESFLLVSDGLMPAAKTMRLPQVIDDAFFGYCFHNQKYFHYHHDRPPITEIENSFEYNCGVFAVVRKLNNGYQVFTDPLAQYPVFYYTAGNEVAVSNNFWIVSFLAGQQFSAEAAVDMVTYLSPICAETLCKNVKRLRAFQTLQINPRFSILEKKLPFFEKRDYKLLLQEARERFKERARAVLAAGTPVLHLTGGTDSRVSFSALLAENYKGPVFSYGDGKSQDRLVFEHMVEKFNLHRGIRKWFSAGQVGHHFMRAVHAFQAFKSNSFGNWGPGKENTYMEVTGYFGEGLLKGFGEFWDRSGELILFSGIRKSSAFRSDVFDKALGRVKNDLSLCLEVTGGNRRMANSLFYIYNRSAAHFGLHSAICNAKFRSVDLLYDPQLLQLLYNCPHSDEHIKDGSLSVELIRTIHSDDLAHVPYESRAIPAFDAKSLEVKASTEINCFYRVNFAQRELPVLKPEIIANPDPILDKFRTYPLEYANPGEIYKNELFDDLFKEVPELQSALEISTKPRRAVEHVALSSLAVGRWLVGSRNLKEYIL